MSSNMSSLDQLRKLSILVADSGDIQAIHRYKTKDATTNPSLILLASKMDCYQNILRDAVKYGKVSTGSLQEQISESMDYLCVLFGCSILKNISGRVSTEIDARLSFDTAKSIEKALKLIHLYESKGIEKDRILIKLAATWEGIQAASILERKYNIKCNLTLIFSLCQAVACADAGITLISPFVGRISDWYRTNTNEKCFDPNNDPGVLSVKHIYNYLKKFDYTTTIMAASFRNIDQIKALAGCDLLTISPSLLNELENDKDVVLPQLIGSTAKTETVSKLVINEQSFRLMINNDKMASEKLSDGIRKFGEDTEQLEQILKKMF